MRWPTGPMPCSSGSRPIPYCSPRNPTSAPSIIGGANADDDQRKALIDLIQHNTRLGMNVAPAARLKDGMLAVYRVGVAIGTLPAMPSAASIYGKDIP